MAAQPRAFVLIPFHEDFADVWENMLKPDLEAAGFIAERADSRLDQQNILRDIVRGIAEADLIVADLTSLNPNVFYELGIAHGLQIPTILITQVADEVPFDLRSYRVNEYSTHFAKVEKFRQKLHEIASKHRDGKVEFGSPVQDYLASVQAPRRGRPRTGPNSAAAPVDQPEPPEEAERGFLDFLVESEEQSAQLNEVFERINTATEEVGKRVESRTAKIERIRGSGRPDATKLVHVTMQQAAHDLTDYAGALDADLPQLEAVAEEMVQGFSAYVEWFAQTASGEGDATQVSEFRQALAQMGEAARETVSALRDYRDTVEGLEGVSRPLTEGSRRVRASLTGIISVIEEFEAFATRAVSLIDEALGPTTTT
jgi:hypothetical protein